MKRELWKNGFLLAIPTVLMLGLTVNTSLKPILLPILISSIS